MYENHYFLHMFIGSISLYIDSNNLVISLDSINVDVDVYLL